MTFKVYDLLEIYIYSIIINSLPPIFFCSAIILLLLISCSTVYFCRVVQKILSLFFISIRLKTTENLCLLFFLKWHIPVQKYHTKTKNTAYISFPWIWKYTLNLTSFKFITALYFYILPFLTVFGSNGQQIYFDRSHIKQGSRYINFTTAS